jgi:hypothetical protein
MRVLATDGLRGARIGVPGDPSDPANDAYYAPLPPRAAAVMRDKALDDAAGELFSSAEIIDDECAVAA